MSQEEEQSRKRGAARQLTDRDEVDDTVGDDNGTWKKADAATMATRKIVKVRGGSKSNLERSGSDVTSPPTSSPPPASSSSSPDAPAPAKTSFFNFASTPAAPAAAPAAAKEETPEKKEEKAEKDVTNGTPTKAPSTPTKEAPTTPAKEASPSSSTPAKETPAEAPSTTTTTPAKEATTTTTPAKEGTPAKDAPTTPAKEGDAPKTETPEPPKFSLPTSFAFPTSFSQTTPFSFPTLSNPGLPAFPASNSTGFTGFSFPTVNFSAGGSSVFSAAGAKKEGSDDEGGDDAAYNPEAEVAVDTAPSKLPVVPTVTGEEDETTIQTKRAKLYAMIEGKWQERGVGNVKLNQAKDGKCRLVMRDEKGKHLRLNTALFPEMKVEKQGDKSVQFVAVGNGGGDVPGPVKAFTTFALRVGRKEDAEELFEAIQKHKAAGGVDAAST